jgi:hypothetical protein
LKDINTFSCIHKHDFLLYKHTFNFPIIGQFCQFQNALNGSCMENPAYKFVHVNFSNMSALLLFDINTNYLSYITKD